MCFDQDSYVEIIMSHEYIFSCLFTKYLCRKTGFDDCKLGGLTTVHNSCMFWPCWRNDVGWILSCCLERFVENHCKCAMTSLEQTTLTPHPSAEEHAIYHYNHEPKFAGKTIMPPYFSLPLALLLHLPFSHSVLPTLLYTGMDDNRTFGKIGNTALIFWIQLNSTSLLLNMEQS